VVTIEGIQVASPGVGVAVVSFIDEHELATKTELSALLHALVRQNELVVADFSQALFVDSSVLSVVLSAHKLALERGTGFTVQLEDGCVAKRAFEITGLLEAIPWTSTRKEAISSYKAPQAPFSVQSGREDKTEPESQAA
jgi:anti-anti-sigma regulatory factor